MRLYLLIAVVAIIAALGGWGLVQSAHIDALKAEAKLVAAERDGALQALKAAQADVKRTQRISDARQVKINQLAVKAADTEKKLNAALKANRDWADAPVPDSVWDALGYPAEGGAGQARPGLDAAGPGAAAGRPRQRGARPAGQVAP